MTTEPAAQPPPARPSSKSWLVGCIVAGGAATLIVVVAVVAVIVFLSSRSKTPAAPRTRIELLPPVPPPARLGPAEASQAETASSFLRSVLDGDYAAALALATPEYARSPGEKALRIFQGLADERGGAKAVFKRSAAIDGGTDVVGEIRFVDDSVLIAHVVLRDGKVDAFTVQAASR